MSETNVLITGASGFVGRNIIKAFNQQDSDYRIVAACRDRNKLHQELPEFRGTIRKGDLRDPGYRRSVVEEIDIICHAGTWASMWNHKQQELENFYHPTIDLMEQAINAGVKRFVMCSSVAIAKPDENKLSDFSQTSAKPFWPHLDYLVRIDQHMQKNASRGMQMTTLRLGHFVGRGNTLGLLPVLVPRLKSRIVPWLAGGNSKMPLIADTDVGRAFVAATAAGNLQNYESFNICGPAFSSAREVIEHIAGKTGLPKPLYSVPYPLGYGFAYLMEKLHPLLPGKAPFLTRSIIHLAEHWECDTLYAERKLGFKAQISWQIAVEEALADLQQSEYPWPAMVQP